MRYGTADARRTADVIRQRVGDAAPVAGIILGSGLGRLADRITDRTVVEYHDVPGFPPPTVAGHSGAVIAGTLGGRRVSFHGRVAIRPSSQIIARTRGTCHGRLIAHVGAHPPSRRPSRRRRGAPERPGRGVTW